MKTDIKKHASLLIGLFILYLAIRYWDGAINLLSMALGAAGPLIIGAVIAYILNILMSFFEKYYFPKSKSKWVTGSRRIVCVLLAFLSLIGIVALIIGITGIIKSKNFVRSESLNISSRIAYTKMTGSLIVSQLFSSVFNSLS